MDFYIDGVSSDRGCRLVFEEYGIFCVPGIYVKTHLVRFRYSPLHGYKCFINIIGSVALEFFIFQ